MTTQTIDRVFAGCLAVLGVYIVWNALAYGYMRGTTPGPGGNFVEGRKAATFGVLASYQSQLELDVAYTTFYGAGRYNELTDRDFLAATIKYSF